MPRICVDCGGDCDTLVRSMTLSLRRARSIKYAVDRTCANCEQPIYWSEFYSVWFHESSMLQACHSNATRATPVVRVR